MFLTQSPQSCECVEWSAAHWLYGGRPEEATVFCFPPISAKVNNLMTECPLNLELGKFGGGRAQLASIVP